MDTPLEESNLAGVGSDADKACREAAAKIEMKWEGAGESVGIQVWRVENRRTDDDVPVFGIEDWPESQYGDFFRGDSYIVLQTQKEEDSDELYWDIYFWIGSESTQDEYGVAAYKANELDDLLGDAPIQHREVESRESPEFLACFPKGINYMDGGVNSGFRHIGADGNEETQDERIPDKLYRVHRSGKGGYTRLIQVPVACSSLNEGDGFILDTGDRVFTWFGSKVNPFEKNKTATMAQNMKDSHHGHAELFIDVGDDNEDFWSLLGGKGDIAPAEEAAEAEQETLLYVVKDDGGDISMVKKETSKDSLESDNVCIIDRGTVCIIWIGKEASKAELQQAMRIVDSQLRNTGRHGSTTVYRIKEGQEKRCPAFAKSF
jgi:hypothetical protein